MDITVLNSLLKEGSRRQEDVRIMSAIVPYRSHNLYFRMDLYSKFHIAVLKILRNTLLLLSWVKYNLFFERKCGYEAALGKLKSFVRIFINFLVSKPDECTIPIPFSRLKCYFFF